MVGAMEQKISFGNFHINYQRRTRCKIDLGTCLGISFFLVNTNEERFGITKDGCQKIVDT